MINHPALAVAAGLISGLAFLAISSGSYGAMFIGYLVPLPLFAAGLSGGLTSALVAAGAAMVLIALGATLSLTWFFGAFSAAPTLVLVRQGLLNRLAPGGSTDWYPAGMLLAWLTGIGAALFLVGVLLMSGHPGGLDAFATDALRQAMARFVPPDAVADAEIMVVAIAPWLPAILVVSWLFMLAINGSMAQGALARFGHNLRPSPKIAKIVLPDWAMYPLLAAVFAAVVGEGSVAFVGRNLAVILAVPILFLGIGVVHATLAGVRNRLAWLVLFYVGLVVWRWAVVAVVVVGIAEQIVGLRRLLQRPHDDQENE